MTLEKTLQQHIDRRLAGLAASPARRARIREATKTQARPPRKVSAALVFALTLALLTAALAIGESFNLFHFFGTNDRRYQELAASSVPAAAAPLEISDEHLGTVTAAIDSVYFDGLTLNLAFCIENSLRYEEYVPTEAEMAQLTQTYALPLLINEHQPGADIVAAYNEAGRSQATTKPICTRAAACTPTGRTPSTPPRATSASCASSAPRCPAMPQTATRCKSAFRWQKRRKSTILTANISILPGKARRSAS